MKIAIISMIREPWGGSEELWYMMAKRALEEGHTIIHLSFDFDSIHPRLAELQRMGAYLYQRPGYFPPGIGKRRRMVKMLINFIRKKLRNPFTQVFRHHPDIVLYNGTCYSIAKEGLLLRSLASDNAAFYIIGHLNAENERGFAPSERQLILTGYRRAKQVYLISQRSLLTAERHLCHTIYNAAIVRNPVNLRDTSLLHFPAAGVVQMALVGNLIVAHKGQDLLLSVLRTSRWMNREWILNIYGDGPDRGYLQELVSYYCLQDRVIFHGRVSDIRQVWQHNQVLLMPSHMEGMPLAVVEAMLCGRPCVVTDVGGMAEWVEDGISGYIAPGSTIAALDETLERAWLEKDRWEHVGLRAHERALSLYDPDAGKTLLEKITKL